jgi:hypothetical protein
VTPAERLRWIVGEKKKERLDYLEQLRRGKEPLLSIQCAEQYVAEWQACSDLLERLLTADEDAVTKGE